MIGPVSTIVEFFVASGDDVAAAAVEGGPGPQFETAGFGNFDAWTSLEEWEHLLTGQGVDNVQGPETLGDEPPLVLVFPPALTAALAGASAETLGDVARQWAGLRAEEGQEIDDGIATRILTEVSGLAGRAQASGAALYCWFG
jgi:hypothetical protein